MDITHQRAKDGRLGRSVGRSVSLRIPSFILHLLAAIPLVYVFLEDRNGRVAETRATRAAMICTIVISEASRLPQVL